MVLSAVLCLLSVKDKTWSQAQKEMASVDQFLNRLKTYKKEEIPPDALKQVRPFLEDPGERQHWYWRKAGLAQELVWIFKVEMMYLSVSLHQPSSRVTTFSQSFRL